MLGLVGMQTVLKIFTVHVVYPSSPQDVLLPHIRQIDLPHASQSSEKWLPCACMTWRPPFTLVSAKHVQNVDKSLAACSASAGKAWCQLSFWDPKTKSSLMLQIECCNRGGDGT